MRKIYSGHSQFVPPATTRTLHTGPGKLRSIIATCDSTAASNALVIYNNTSAANPILINFHLLAGQPLVIHFPENTPLVFTAGLTAVTGAGIRAYLLTEAEQ